MHPDFVLELGRQYQAQARDDAARWRLARGIRRRRARRDTIESAQEREAARPRDAAESAAPDSAAGPPDPPQAKDKEPLPAG